MCDAKGYYTTYHTHDRQLHTTQTNTRMGQRLQRKDVCSLTCAKSTQLCMVCKRRASATPSATAPDLMLTLPSMPPV